jgi:hypothetical protein
MNQISTRQTTPSTYRATEVAPLIGADLTRLSRLGNALEETPGGRWELPDTAFVADDDRQWLEARSSAIERSLRPGHPDTIASLVAGMFLRFPPAGQVSDTEGRIAAYVADLQPFPIWAIERAIAGLKGPWAPAANILVDAVRNVLIPTREERAKIRRLLTADVYHVPSAEERARIKAQFDELLAELHTHSEFDKPSARRSSFAPPQNSQKQASEWLTENAGSISAPPLSDKALGIFHNRWPQSQESEQGAA